MTTTINQIVVAQTRMLGVGCLEMQADGTVLRDGYVLDDEHAVRLIREIARDRYDELAEFVVEATSALTGPSAGPALYELRCLRLRHST